MYNPFTGISHTRTFLQKRTTRFHREEFFANKLDYLLEVHLNELTRLDYKLFLDRGSNRIPEHLLEEFEDTLNERIIEY